MGSIERYSNFKKAPFLRRWDIILLLTLVLAAVLVFVLMPSGSGKYVEVYSNNVLVHRVPLDFQESYRVTYAGDWNDVLISSGKVYVENSTCADGYCKHTKISNVGETIVCLPNKLVIKVVGKSDDGIDGEV